MKYLAIIQARYNSTRLRGKVLMDLCGKPVIQRVIERVQQSKFVDEVMVATGIGKENLPIVQFCASMGVRVFAGSEDDVLDRYYQLAKLVNPKYIVRVTADCPCYDWTLLDLAIEQMQEDTDYCWDEQETLPDGMDLEIIRFSVLKEAWQKAILPSEREHVTPYIRNNNSAFNICNVCCPYGNFGHLRLTLDEPEDFQLLQKITKYFKANKMEKFVLRDVWKYFEMNPDDIKINSHFARNEGYRNSLLEEQKD